MQIIEKKWEDRIFPDIRDSLVIRFKIPVSTVKNDLGEIVAEMYWKNAPGDNYAIPPLVFSSKSVIYHTFKNGITIKGTLEWEKINNPNIIDTDGIWGNFKYYKKDLQSYIWHTEGFLISFNPRKVPDVKPIPIPDDIIIPDDEIDAGIILKPANGANSYSDLFPYIYVSAWPKISDAEKKGNFFGYVNTNSSPPVTTFYDRLVALKASGNRVGMENEAIAFLEGIEPYQNQFITQINKQLGFIGSFAALYNDLKTTKSNDNVVVLVCNFLKTDVTSFVDYLKSPAYIQLKERFWFSYFALLIVMGYKNSELEAIIKILTICNYVEIVFSHLNTNTKATVTVLEKNALFNLFHATILLDKDIFPLPPYSESAPPSANTPIVPYAIGNLQLVKYKLLRYEMGELAHITSVMPGEKRKVVNRKLDRITDKEQITTYNESISDHKTTEKSNDFSKELWNAIAETTQTSNYPDPGLISTYGPPTNITVKGSYTKAQTTQTPEKKQITLYAKKVLNLTTQRISEKINKVRSHTQLKELEDTATSILDNSNGKDPAYGMYCWLNKVYKAKVVNYGNRMLFTFLIPNPAANYISQAKIIEGNNLTEPLSLSQQNINTYKDITPDNYLALCQYYQLKAFPIAPNTQFVVSDIMQLGESKLIVVPKGYEAAQATISYAFGEGNATAIVNGFIGKSNFSFDQSKGDTGTQSFELNKEQNSIAVGIVSSNVITMSPPSSVIDFQLSVEIICLLNIENLLSWQISIYQLISTAYAEQYAIYNQKSNASNGKEERENPLKDYLIVKQELEKGVREQLQNHIINTLGLPSNFDKETASPGMEYNYPENAQYINSSLEWDEMTYTFLDKYDSQNELFTVSSLSPDYFSGFLKAAYARVTIPVAPHYNQGFLYFLSTGIVWSPADNFAPCFDDSKLENNTSTDQTTIVLELKNVFQHPNLPEKIIDSWEVVIPTSMQMLQKNNSLKINNYE
jgi:hypothetical protein